MSVGQQVTLVTANGKSFNGVLCAIDDQAGKVSLKHVVTEGCRISDIQTFFASDIKDLSFSDSFAKRDNNSESLLDHVKRVPGQFLSKRNTPRHLMRCPAFNADRMLLSQIASEDDVDDQGIGSGEDGDNFEDFYETDDYLMLCRPCERFREVIIYLMKQEYVAVIFYGVEVGRKGTLSLLQIATNEYFFIFDVLRLGKEGFVEGLQELLESQNVMKIIHNSRMASDILYHQYNVVLSNVFDTQVAGAFVYRNSNEGDWPRFVESLPTALMNHLHVAEENIHYSFVRERSRTMDEEIWLQRPLSKQLLISTLKNLRRLIPLYQYMWEKLMMPFKVGVEIYLDNVRDAPEGVAAKQHVVSHLLPHAFQDLEKRINSTHRKYHRERPSSKTYDQNGFRENSVVQNIHRHKVISSRDSIWHESKRNFPSTRSSKSQSQSTPGLPAEEVGKGPKIIVPLTKDIKKCNASLTQSNASNFQSKLMPVEEVEEQVPIDSVESPPKQPRSFTLLPPKATTPLDRGLVESPSNLSGFDLKSPLSHLSATLPKSSTPINSGSIMPSLELSDNAKSSSHSPMSLPKSSTPKDSGFIETPSSDIRRSALFKLDSSASLAYSSGNEGMRSGQPSDEKDTNSTKAAYCSSESTQAKKPTSTHSRLQDDCKTLNINDSYKNTNTAQHAHNDRLSVKQERGSLDSSYRSSNEASRSEDESDFMTQHRKSVHFSMETSFDEMNIIPAGAHVPKIGKKRAKRIQQQMLTKSKDEPRNQDSPRQKKTADVDNTWEDDLGNIPMHHSLHRSKSCASTGLNGSESRTESLLFDDVISMSAIHSKSVLSQLHLPQCQPVQVPLSATEDESGDDFEESYINQILKLEEVQKILRQTRLEKPSADIKKRLLSSKIKF